MNGSTGKGQVILRMAAAMILFSIFFKLDSLLQIANILVGREWSFIMILLFMVLLRMIFAGVAVLIVLPLVLDFKDRRWWLRGYLRIDGKVVLLGILSFVVFAALATLISVAMGVFKGDIATVFATPDINPEPDVIGWGYFLLALVPAIWEELAYRGWMQSKAREAFSIKISVLLSALFFALFHFSNLVDQGPVQVITGAIMAFFFGLGWGVMTVWARSVVPAMIVHFLVDSLGQLFLGVDMTDPALLALFFVILVLTYPIFNIILVRIMYGSEEPSLTVDDVGTAIS